jgi:hypothetical protein
LQLDRALETQDTDTSRLLLAPRGCSCIAVSQSVYGIHYFVKPYASDQNLPGRIFHRKIGIRDVIFPAQ